MQPCPPPRDDRSREAVCHEDSAQQPNPSEATQTDSSLTVCSQQIDRSSCEVSQGGCHQRRPLRAAASSAGPSPPQQAGGWAKELSHQEGCLGVLGEALPNSQLGSQKWSKQALPGLCSLGKQGGCGDLVTVSEAGRQERGSALYKKSNTKSGTTDWRRA